MIGDRRDDPRCPSPSPIEMVADDPARSQRGKKRCRIFEVGDLDVRRAEGVRHVSIAACTGRESVNIGVVGCPAVQTFEAGLGVADLEGVDQTCLDQLVDRTRRQTVPQGIEGVGDVDQAALIANAARRLQQARTGRYSLGEEQTDDLALANPKLLAGLRVTA